MPQAGLSKGLGQPMTPKGCTLKCVLFAASLQFRTVQVVPLGGL